MASERDQQLRRGLARSLDFITQQALARREQDASEQAAQRTAQAGAIDAANKQRYQAALDLAKLGNIGVQAGLHDYARTGNLGALEGIGEFDRTGAQARLNAKDFLDNLLQRDQLNAAGQVARQVPGMEGLRFAIPQKQQAEIDLLGARKLDVEAETRGNEAVRNARINQIDMLTKGAKAKLQQIQKETENLVRKGKVDDDYIDETGKALNSLEDTIAGEIKSRLDDPSSYDDPAEKTKVAPEVQVKLRDLYNAYEDIRARKKRIASYRESQTPAAISGGGKIPMRNAEPYEPYDEEFRRNLLNRLLQGTAPSAAQPTQQPLEW